MGVFVGIENKNGNTTVFNARKYQETAYETFMSNKNIVKIDFNYPKNIIFNLQKFNASGLKGNYSRFCVLENDKKEQHILSDNEELLKGFAGWKNRVTMFGGYKKSTKRKHVTNKSTKSKKLFII